MSTAIRLPPEKPEFMHNGKRVSIVFPAFNEAAGIATAVREFCQIPAVDEVLVVDNRSSDRTAALAREQGARVITEDRQGYGFALRRGLTDAAGDLIVLCEPDGTFVARDLYKLLAYAEDFEMVCGTRTTRELIWAEANMGWFLRLGNIAVAKFLEVLYSTPSLSDCGCTYRLIHREAAQRLLPDLRVGASHFLPEMIILARRAKISFIEIPVTYRGRVGDSKITGTLRGTLRTGLRMIGLILRYRLEKGSSRRLIVAL